VSTVRRGKGDRAFEAPDLIEVMEEAVRYNRFLVDELAGHGLQVLRFGGCEAHRPDELQDSLDR